jgi:hypothetical protein
VLSAPVQLNVYVPPLASLPKKAVEEEEEVGAAARASAPTAGKAPIAQSRLSMEVVRSTRVVGTSSTRRVDWETVLEGYPDEAAADAARGGTAGGAAAGGGRVSGDGEDKAKREARGGALRMTVRGRWSYDTEMRISATVRAVGGPVTLKDVNLVLPLREELARYLMGLERHGRRIEKHVPFRWVWKAASGAHQVWLGDVYAGVRLKLTGPEAAWDSPMYKTTKRELGTLTWHNGGAGSVYVDRKARVVARTGPITMAEDEERVFVFELMLTPCQPLRQRLHRHWGERYTQIGYPAAKMASPEDLASAGSNVLNYHQGIGVNPYINYPFVRRAIGRLGEHVERAHKRGLRVKAYYTIRELSNHAAELWVLRSLGQEILREGEGGTGDPWLKEHLVSGYRPCWHNTLPGYGGYDAAVCNNGLSRWANYYVEGLAELIRAGGLDGLYYDGIDFGVETLRRVRAVLQRERGERGLLDLHSGNNANPNWSGRYGSVSPAIQYMGTFPHVDSLWFGEGFDYAGETDDYWLIEVSGLAFGLAGNLMCDHGYAGPTPWRGMLYGTMGRMCTWPETDGFRHALAQPAALWGLADSVGLPKARMHGYWEPSPPARLSGCPKVRLTSYVRKGKLSLLALASWTTHEEMEQAALRDTVLKAATAAGEAASVVGASPSSPPPPNATTGAVAGYEQQQREKAAAPPAPRKRKRSLSAYREKCELELDWAALGLTRDKSELFAPAVHHWQLAQRFNLVREPPKPTPPSSAAVRGNLNAVATIPVAPERGLFLVVAAKGATLESLSDLLSDTCDENCKRAVRAFNETGNETVAQKYDLFSMRKWGSHVRQ